MKVGFDHQIFLLQKFGGISRYFVELINALSEMGVDSTVVAPFYKNHYLSDLSGSVVVGRKVGSLLGRSDRLISYYNRRVTERRLRDSAFDVWHETYYGFGVDRPIGQKSVLTVYDMIHEKFPADFPENDRTISNKRAAVLNSDRIIAISHSTKKDLCEILGVNPDKVDVVHLGFADFKRNAGETFASPAAGRPFLLYVGNRGGYKNFKGLLQAFASSPTLREAFDLIAFGGGAFDQAEIDLIGSLGLRTDRVRQLAGSDALLGDLYRHARAFVYPSRYEGFGLPPLEAMAHDCPVVVSNTSSLPEVVGDAGVYFDPENLDQMISAIDQVVHDDDLRKTLVERGRRRLQAFTWRACAAGTLASYRQCIEGE